MSHGFRLFLGSGQFHSETELPGGHRKNLRGARGPPFTATTTTTTTTPTPTRMATVARTTTRRARRFYLTAHLAGKPTTAGPGLHSARRSSALALLARRSVQGARVPPIGGAVDADGRFFRSGTACFRRRVEVVSSYRPSPNPDPIQSPAHRHEAMDRSIDRSSRLRHHEDGRSGTRCPEPCRPAAPSPWHMKGMPTRTRTLCPGRSCWDMIYK
jgi:hypothetical protein